MSRGCRDAARTPSCHSGSPVAGGCPLCGHEEFTATFAEVTDALPLEVAVQLQSAVTAWNIFGVAALHDPQERHRCAPLLKLAARPCRLTSD